MSLVHVHDLAAPERPPLNGRPWMRPPRPTPTPWPTPTPFPSPTPTPLVPTPTPTPMPTPVPTPEAWIRALVEENGFDPNGRFIVIDQDRQRMIVAENGFIVAEFPVSTGDPDRNYHTPAWVGRVGEYWGTFSAFGVSADNAWFLFKAAGSILIHGAPYVVEDGVKRYKEIYALGAFPASRGCIRLRPEDAEWFTQWGPYGVPIIILPWTRPPAQG
ncbi:MAG TPA: L,D-transpeptidase [Caldilineae bacterium]|nr:L,D-transpeptidase [Caldilineae bacterium]